MTETVREILIGRRKELDAQMTECLANRDWLEQQTTAANEQHVQITRAIQELDSALGQ